MSWGLSFQSGKDLKKTALEYGKMHNTRMMVAYTHAAGGDAPTLWDGTDNCRFPEGYCETVEVLQDTPKEGFVYTMFEADPQVMLGIDMIRDVW